MHHFLYFELPIMVEFCFSSCAWPHSLDYLSLSKTTKNTDSSASSFSITATTESVELSNSMQLQNDPRSNLSAEQFLGEAGEGVCAPEHYVHALCCIHTLQSSVCILPSAMCMVFMLRLCVYQDLNVSVLHTMSMSFLTLCAALHRLRLAKIS